jgi:hypothetical protein
MVLLFSINFMFLIILLIRSMKIITTFSCLVNHPLLAFAKLRLHDLCNFYVKTYSTRNVHP